MWLKRRRFRARQIFILRKKTAFQAAVQSRLDFTVVASPNDSWAANQDHLQHLGSISAGTNRLR